MERLAMYPRRNRITYYHWAARGRSIIEHFGCRPTFKASVSSLIKKSAFRNECESVMFHVCRKLQCGGGNLRADRYERRAFPGKAGRI